MNTLRRAFDNADITAVVCDDLRGPGGPLILLKLSDQKGLPLEARSTAGPVVTP